jgi:dGTP triphosphohydrolase
MAEREKELKAFLYKQPLPHPDVMKDAAKGADQIVLDLFDAYFAEPGARCRRAGARGSTAPTRRSKARHVADFWPA